MADGLAPPTNFKYRPHPDIAGMGLLAFSASMVLLLGLLNLFYAIVVIAGSDIFIRDAAWLVGDARPWGWLMLIVALIQLTAPVSILRGGQWGRWVGILSAISNVAVQIMFFSTLPAVAIILLLIDVGVIHALLVYGGGRALYRQYS